MEDLNPSEKDFSRRISFSDCFKLQKLLNLILEFESMEATKGMMQSVHIMAYCSISSILASSLSVFSLSVFCPFINHFHLVANYFPFFWCCSSLFYVFNFARNRTFVHKQILKLTACCPNTSKSKNKLHVQHQQLQLQMEATELDQDSNQDVESLDDTSIPIERSTHVTVQHTIKDEKACYAMNFPSDVACLAPSTLLASSSGSTEIDKYARQSGMVYSAMSSSTLGIGVSTSSETSLDLPSTIGLYHCSNRSYIAKEKSDAINFSSGSEGRKIKRHVMIHRNDNKNNKIIDSSSSSETSIISEETTMEDSGDTLISALSNEDDAFMEMMLDYGWTDQSTLYNNS